jgi:hypothetical protein
MTQPFSTQFDQKSKPDIFSIFVYHVFARVSVRGVQKHDKKYQKNKSDPIAFSYSEPPTQHGDHRLFVFAGPLHNPFGSRGTTSSGVLDISALRPATGLGPRAAGHSRRTRGNQGRRSERVFRRMTCWILPEEEQLAATTTTMSATGCKL